jgi:hypothetical protein
MNELIPILMLRTGYLKPKDTPHFSKQDQSKKYTADFICMRATGVIPTEYRFEISVFTALGTMLYSDRFVVIEDDKFQEDLDVMKKQIEMYLNNCFFGGYEKALLIFDGESYSRESFLQIVTEWSEDTENLLYS